MESPKETKQPADDDAYDAQICGWFLRALESGEENIRRSAAESLYCFYVRKENYEKDVKETERIMRILLGSSDTLTQFTQSDLYRHLYASSEKPVLSFTERLEKELLQGFLDEETFGYMRGNAFWEGLNLF